MTVRVQGGAPTSKLIQSTHMGGNAEQFADILALHVPAGGKIADVTYGGGVFWVKVEPDTYTVVASDIELRDGHRFDKGFTYLDAVDCRALPHADQSFDCVVLDPPYMEGFYRRAVEQLACSGSHIALRRAYSELGSTCEPAEGVPRWHDAVVDMYMRAGVEAHRVLRPGGVLIVKCQDEVSSNKQRLTHVEIVTGFEDLGFHCRDLFVQVRNNAPGVSRLKTQVHARKNHSYFLVFERPAGQAKRVSSVRGSKSREETAARADEMARHCVGWFLGLHSECDPPLDWAALRIECERFADERRTLAVFVGRVAALRAALAKVRTYFGKIEGLTRDGLTAHGIDRERRKPGLENDTRRAVEETLDADDLAVVVKS